MTDALRLRPAGEGAMIAYLGGDSPEHIAGRIQALTRTLPAVLGDVLLDLIPSYDSVLVVFDALQCDHYHVASLVRSAAAELGELAQRQSALVEIPVYYSPESGEDLENLAGQTGLGIETLIELHSAREYRVYAIGFAPGFAYLGQVDERIAAPRLSTPRQRVPRGAVAIADRQTAVYPASSPGGWNLIGRSPMRMFDPAADPPMPVSVGDRVRVVPIDRKTYLASGGEL